MHPDQQHNANNREAPMFDYAVDSLIPGELQDRARIKRKSYGWTLTAPLPFRRRLILDFIRK